MEQFSDQAATIADTTIDERGIATADKAIAEEMVHQLSTAQNKSMVDKRQISKARVINYTDLSGGKVWRKMESSRTSQTASSEKDSHTYKWSCRSALSIPDSTFVLLAHRWIGPENDFPSHKQQTRARSTGNDWQDPPAITNELRLINDIDHSGFCSGMGWNGMGWTMEAFSWL